MYKGDTSPEEYRTKGNINLAERNGRVENEDGSVSTVRTMSFNEGGKEILIPTIIPNGMGGWKQADADEAIDYYHKTGENLGKFNTVAEADKYAKKVHEIEAQRIGEDAANDWHAPKQEEEEESGFGKYYSDKPMKTDGFADVEGYDFNTAKAAEEMQAYQTKKQKEGLLEKLQKHYDDRYAQDFANLNYLSESELKKREDDLNNIKSEMASMKKEIDAIPQTEQRYNELVAWMGSTTKMMENTLPAPKYVAEKSGGDVQKGAADVYAEVNKAYQNTPLGRKDYNKIKARQQELAADAEEGFMKTPDAVSIVKELDAIKNAKYTTKADVDNANGKMKALYDELNAKYGEYANGLYANDEKLNELSKTYSDNAVAAGYGWYQQSMYEVENANINSLIDMADKEMARNESASQGTFWTSFAESQVRSTPSVMALGDGEGTTAGTLAKLNENYDKSKTVRRTLIDAKKTLVAEKQRRDGTMKGLGFVRGVSNVNYENFVPFAGLSDSFTKLGLSLDIRNGKTYDQLDDMDKALLDAMQLEAYANANYGNNAGAFERLGGRAPELIKFTLEYLATDGLTGAGKIGERIATKGAEKFVMKQAGKSISKFADVAGRRVLPTIEGMAAEAGMRTFANPIGIGNIMRKTADNMAGNVYFDEFGIFHAFDDNKDFALSFWQGAMTEYLSNLTESFGEHLFGRIPRKLLESGELKYAGTQLGNMFKLMSKNKISDSFRLSSRVSSALGIQGVIGETEEEFSENLLTPLVYADAEQGENYFHAFKRSIRQSFSKRNVLDTFMSCAFMSMGTGMAVNGVNKAMNGFLSESGIAAAKDEKILKTFKGVEINDLRHFIQNHSLEEIDQHIIDLAEDNGWNDDQKMAAAVYVLDMGRYAQEKRYESLGMKEQLKEAEQSAKDLVNRRDGENIYNATLNNGEQVNIVGGEVGFSVDEEGNPILNKATSSSTFTVRLSDGSVDMVSSNEVKSLDAVISFQEQIANDKKAIMQKAEAKMQAEGLITPTMKNVWGEEPKAGNITIVDGKECTFTGVKDEKGYELKDEKGNSIHITEKAWIDYGVGIKMNELAKLAGLSEQEKQDAFNMLADANDDLETMGKMLSMSKEKVEQSEWDGLTKVFSDRMQFDKNGNIIDYGEPIVTAGYLLAVSKGDADEAMQMLQEEIEQKRIDSESYKGKNMADSAKGRNQAKSDYENLQGVAKILEQFADKRAEASNVSNKVEVEQGKTYKAIIDGEERNAMFASDNGNGTISVAFFDEDGHPTGSTDMTKSKFRRYVSEYQAKNNPQQDTAEQDNAAKAESAPQGEENGTTQEENEAAYPTDKKGNPLWMQMTDEQVDAALAELSELGIDVKDYVANILGEAKKRKAKADKMKPKSTDFVKVKEEAVKIAEEKAASSANVEFWQRQSDRINKTTEAATTQETPAATQENQTQDTDTQGTATETTEETQEEQTPEETATEEAPAGTETETETETEAETPSEETPTETQQETETEVPTEQETEKPNEEEVTDDESAESETPETEESDDIPNEESDDLNTQQESEQIKDAAAKVIAETSEGSTGNKFTDSGEKIGGAKKDQGITHKKNDSENSGVPTWRKKYSITNVYPDDVYSRNKPIIGEGKFIITYEKKHKGLRNRTTTRIVGTSLFGDPIIFNSIEDAERFIPIQEAQDQGFRVAKEEDGKYFIGRRASNGKIVKYASLETEEDAKAYLASEEGCKSLLNHKRENFELPALDKITRNGKDWRKGKHITNTKVFMDEFGFRGVEFGEWLNQDERQQFIDYAYDALCDLADVLGISRKALSLNGELSIAFGARGSKGAKAHYEPNRAVINLTKMNGAGSLAHEWAHALDNYFGLMQRDKEVKRDENGVITNSSTEDFSSEEESFMNKGLRPEVLEAIKKIVSVMRSKEVTSKMDVKNAQKSLDYVKERFENTKKRIIDRATNGTDSYVYNRKTKKRESVHYAATPEQIARITELLDNIGERKDKGMKSEWEGYWTLTGNDYKELIDILADVFHYKRGGKDIHEYMERSSGFMYDADKIISCDNYLQRALNNESETTTVKTDLLLDSESFDRGRASAYFSRKLEMFARCFETYVNDKMRENGTNNDYLTYSKSPIYIEMFGKSPYPEGEEKKAINEAFDNLFNTVQEKTVDGKQVLYQKHYDTDSPIATKKQAKKISGKLKKLGLKGNVTIVDDLEAVASKAEKYGIKVKRMESNGISGLTLPNGDVVLVNGAMRLDTPFHEFAHKIFAYAKDNKETSRLYDAVLKVAENAPDNVKEYVKKHYSDLEGEEYLDEVFAWALCAMNKGNLSEFLGERGFETGSPVDMAKAQTWYDKVWNAIKELWDSVKGVFNGGRYADLSVFDAYDEMSVESLSQKLYDVMMGGKKLPNAVEDNSETERSQRTLTQEDMDYLDAVERGDMEAAQRMVDEAADKRLEEWQKLQDDKDMVAYKYHRGRLGKNTKKMYAVFNVGENGMTPAYAGTENTIPIGVVLDAQNLTSYQSKTKKDDNGNPTSYVAGTTGASFKDAGLSKDEVPQSLWNKRWLLERGGKHGSDVPNFSQMNVKNAETGEMGANGAMPHNKLVFEIECYYDEDLTEEAKNGRTIKGKQQGFPKIEPNQFYDFKTNPNAKGNWGIAGTFKITRVVPYSEIVQKCEEAGLKPQVWNGGYNPSEFGVSESEVQKKVEEGEAKKLLDPVTYDDNGNVIPLSQRFNKDMKDVRYQKVDTDSDTKKEKVELFPEGSKGKLQDKEVFARDEVNRHIGSNNSTSSFFNRAVNQSVMKWADGLRPLRKAMELIAKMTNKPIRDSENAFVKALLAGSIAVAKMKNEAKPLINNLCLEIALIVKKSNASIDEITDYLIAKHGLERNKWFKDKVDAEATKGMNEEEVTAYIDEEGLSELEDKSGLRGLSEKLGLDPNNYTANAEKVVADFEAKNGDCKSLWNALHNITGYILNTDLATGRIDADTMEEFKTRWEYYIPLRGFANPTSDEYYDYSVKDASMNLAERKAKGRTSLADSPIATLLNMLDSSITMACQNDARKALYYFALNHKSDLFVTAKSWYVKNEKTGEWEEASLQDRGIVFNPNNPISNDELQQRVAEYDKEMEALRKKGLAKHDVNPREMGVIVKPALVDEHIVECYINGKKYMVINTGDPDIIKSLNGKEEHWGSYDSKTRIFKDSESGFFDAVNKIYQNPDRALKNIVRFEAKIKTSWSPTFFLNNFKKDIPFAIFSAYVSGGGKNALVFTKNVGKAMWYLPALITKGRCRSVKATQYWNEFLNSGGETGFTRNMSVDYHEKEYRKLVGKLLKGKDISKEVFSVMEFFNRWSETVSRFGSYVSSRENGGSIQESTLAAKNITLNFSQHGNGLGASLCRSRFNFFNAQIQSNYRMMQLAKENPVRFTAAVMTIMASGIVIPMLNLLALSVWGDDDDWRTYRFLSDYTASHNLIIFTGNGFYIQPIPQEFILFWGTGVSISRHYMGYERETTVKGDIARLAMEYIPFDIAAQGDTNYIYTLLRAATPDYAKTITECAVNQNFMGSHIYKETPYNKDDAGWTKAMPNNYEFLVNICKKLNNNNSHEKDGINLNPAIIEHLVEGYTGGVGRFIHDVSKSIETAAQGDLDWNNVPYIRQAYVTPDIRKYKGGVYAEANYYIFDVMKNTNDRYKAYIQDLVAIQGGIDYYDNSMRKAEQDKAYKDTGNDVFRMNSERLAEKMREYEATPEYQQCRRILEHLDEIKASPEFAIASNETSMALSNTIEKLREYRKRARHESDVSDEDLRNGELTYEYLDNELIHLEIDFISNAEQILDKDSRGNSIREKAATWRKNINFENGDDYEGTTEEDTEDTDENE